MRVRCSGPSKSHCLPTAIQSTAASRRAPTAVPGDSPGTDFLRIQDLSCSEDSSDPYHFNYNPPHYWRGEIYEKDTWSSDRVCLHAVGLRRLCSGGYRHDFRNFEG